MDLGRWWWRIRSGRRDRDSTVTQIMPKNFPTEWKPHDIAPRHSASVFMTAPSMAPCTNTALVIPTPTNASSAYVSSWVPIASAYLATVSMVFVNFSPTDFESSSQRSPKSFINLDTPSNDKGFRGQNLFQPPCGMKILVSVTLLISLLSHRRMAASIPAVTKSVTSNPAETLVPVPTCLSYHPCGGFVWTYTLLNPMSTPRPKPTSMTMLLPGMSS